MQPGTLFTFDQLCAMFGRQLPAKRRQELARTLIAKGWFIPLRPGVYAAAGTGTPPYLTLAAPIIAYLLAQEAYVSFEAALHQHGLLAEPPVLIRSVSLRARPPQTIQNRRYAFVTAEKRYFFGWRTQRVDGRKVKIARPEKALIDLLLFSSGTDALVRETLAAHTYRLDYPRLAAYLRRCPAVRAQFEAALPETGKQRLHAYL